MVPCDSDLRCRVPRARFIVCAGGTADLWELKTWRRESAGRGVLSGEQLNTLMFCIVPESFMLLHQLG